MAQSNYRDIATLTGEAYTEAVKGVRAILKSKDLSTCEVESIAHRLGVRFDDNGEIANENYCIKNSQAF